MKNTKENVIKVMKEMENNAHACANIWEKDGDKEMYKSAMSEATTLWSVIEMLTNQEYFDKMAKTFVEEK